MKISKKKISILFVIIFMMLILSFMSCSTYYHAYKPVQQGEFVEKILPEAFVLQTSSDMLYEKSANSLFRNLFNYININKIKMTVPVESDAFDNTAKMRFYIGPDADLSTLKPTQNVDIVRLKQRLVVAYASRGGYNQKNLTEAKTRLDDWFSEQKKYKKSGEPYAVFWDSPFKLWFLKRFEIHLPVEKTE